MRSPHIRIFNETYPQLSKNYEQLVEEITSRNSMITWFTYRKGFTKGLCNTKITSDAGWGCMIRTGQMLVHEALRRHTNTKQIDLFLDNKKAAFSI